MAFDISNFAATAPKPVSDSDTMREIRTELIFDNPRNFYPLPEGQELDELVDSIRANGVLEPPTVVPDTQGYRLISGHSRMAAVRRLRHEEPASPRWSTVLCRVLPAMTDGQELTAVIEANRQRVKSPGLLAEEAERLTAAYMARKRAGEELPGRIRERVANALQVSQTKLANLAAIKKGIQVPGLLRAWERQEMPEQVALLVARMSSDQQYRLLDWAIDHHVGYTLREVQKFSVCYTVCRRQCPEGGAFCGHAAQMYEHDYRYGEWHGNNCCQSCLDRDTCPAACPHVERKAPERQTEEPEPVALNPAVEDPRLKGMMETFCSRVRLLRARTGMSKKDFAESIREYPGTYAAWENASLAGSGTMPKLALCLGTTTDYLYGLTDRPEPVGWAPLDQGHFPPEGRLVLLRGNGPLGGVQYRLARVVGSRADQYPFDDADSGLSVKDWDGNLTEWMEIDEGGMEHAEGND